MRSPSHIARCLPAMLAGVLVMAVALAAGLASAQPSDAPVRVKIEKSGAGVTEAKAGVAIQVEDETGKDALRIAAFTNDALRRAGLKPDATAGARLYLQFERPETVSGRTRPPVSVTGRGGSSSDTRLGLEVQVPVRDRAAPLKPVPHRLEARLETRPGTVVWHFMAETDAIAGRGERAALKRLARTVADALAAAAHTGGSTR